ncbi:hypothetical protein NliqN6_5644 [Naganishia liquefaciens]|uniref:polynucleotide adenylyltransferase n=1 Tax=Naganishia liquefaciens TaxID=104408 RepID=A0A8H3TY34_9TREE|nr:hypothetical protein NliqN6_5644 [Naganishia liquefaciens]
MPKKSTGAKSGPSEGIQQAPTVPSVSGLANPSEAATVLSKSARKRRNKREAEANEPLPEASGKKSRKSKKKAKLAAAASAAEGAAGANGKSAGQDSKKKKSKHKRGKDGRKDGSESSTSKKSKKDETPKPSPLNNAVQGNGSRPSGAKIIGTGHFVADSLPQNSRKRKFDRMAQSQIGGRAVSPWCADIEWFSASNMTQLLNDEILACSAWISPTFEEHEVRTLMISKVRRIIKQVERDAEVYAFGSHETKLYLPGGDIDIVVDSSTVYARTPQKFFYALIAQLLREGICHESEIGKVFHARVPIIKIKTIEGGIKIDISLYNTNGVKAGEVVKQYLDALPAARPLVLLVKAYMWRLGKNEVFTGGMGSYSTICLAISFLQVSVRLSYDFRSIEGEIRSQQHPKIRNNEIDPMKNLGILLIEFFELYGLVFNWEDLGISIREGGSYFDKRDRNWYKSGFQPNFAIEDPQDQLNDISKGTYDTLAILESFRTAYETLRDNIETRAEELRSWQTSSRNGVRNAHHRNWLDDDGAFMPQRLSLLRGVIGFDESTLRHRAGLGRLYHTQELHRQLRVPFVKPPMTATQAQSTQPPAQRVPTSDKFIVDLLPATGHHRRFGGAKDTVQAIHMDESDPEDVGQRDRNAEPYFDSDSDVSEVPKVKRSKPNQSIPSHRRIQTPSGSASSSTSSDSSGSDSRSVIEVSDEDSEEESTRYRVGKKRQPVKGSKEAEMGLGSGDASDSANVIDLDEDSDGVEIVNEKSKVVSSEAPVIHFSETTSRSSGIKPDDRHSFKPSDIIRQGRSAAPKPRHRIPSPTSDASEERVSPPNKRSKPSRSSRQQFWQSKSGVETGSSRRDQDGDQSARFENDWEEDLDRARKDAAGRDPVAANDDFVSL